MEMSVDVCTLVCMCLFVCWEDGKRDEVCVWWLGGEGRDFHECFCVQSFVILQNSSKKNQSINL